MRLLEPRRIGRLLLKNRIVMAPMVTPPSVSPVIDPYSEYAVEAALRIKDAQGGKITIISLGANLLREVVKKPLAMGADELIVLEDEAFTEGDS